MVFQRTDLALETCRDVLKHKPKTQGIECKKWQKGPITGEEVRILNAEGERETGRAVGRYLTLNTGALWLDEAEAFREKVLVLAQVIREMAEELGPCRSVMIAGLGNESITADAIGPRAVKELVVTHHIKKNSPRLFREWKLFDLCAIAPGVLGQTGLESADVIAGVTERYRPDLILVIDALASRELARLVRTIQLCDTGIRPGSGVGNDRPKLDRESLGCPVISVGVPTVVDAATLASDAIEAFTCEAVDQEAIRHTWEENGLNFYVTPKETDAVIRTVSRFVAYGINLAFHQNMTYEDMLSLIG